MTHVVVVLFLGAAPDAHAADLDAWAAARMVEVRPAEEARIAATAYTPELVAQLEAGLESARLLSAALDDPAALARLAAAERLLREHPELPQAPWLMAERLELEAVIAARKDDHARALELRRRASLLEGARAAVFGSSPTAAPPSPPTTAARVISGLSAGDQLWWNGKPSSRRITIAAGEHHARVVRRGRTLWAGWVNVEPALRRVQLPLPAALPCSRDDLGTPRITGERVVAEPGTRCESWAVARPAAEGGIQVASCQRARCGPLLGWRQSYGAIYAGPPQPRPEPGFPTWAAVTLAGVGAAAVVGVVAWRAGAFEEPAPAGAGWRFYPP